MPILACSGARFGVLGVRNWTALLELQFGIFRFSVAPFVPKLQRGNFAENFIIFLSFIAINGLKFLVFCDKSKCEKNATHNSLGQIHRIFKEKIECIFNN